MDNKIEVFKNEQFGEVRTILIGGEPWFVVADVCAYFGVANRNRIMQNVDAEDKGGTQMDTPGGVQTVAIVNESGLYSVLFALQPTKARGVSKEHIEERQKKLHDFKRWITHEVIPTIRKTGGYMTDSLLERIQKEPAVIVEFAQALILEKNRVKALECELNTAKPKADYYDAFINPDDCTNIRTTAKELKIPERKFVQFLLREKYLFRSPSGQLLPYNKDSNAGLFIVRDFVTYCYTGSQTYFTPKGKDVIRMKFQKKCGEELLSKMAR